MSIIEISIVIYLASMAIAAFINMLNTTRIPRSWWDVIKLTFLPYVLWNLKKIKGGNE